MITVLPYSQYKYLNIYITLVDDESNLTFITSLIEFIAMFAMHSVMIFQIILNRHKIKESVNNGITLFNDNINMDNMNKRNKRNFYILFCKIILFEFSTIGFMIYINVLDNVLNPSYQATVILLIVTVSVFVSNILFASLLQIATILDIFNETIGKLLLEINSVKLSSVQIKMRINKVDLIIQKYRQIKLFSFEVIVKFELFYIFYVLFAFLVTATEVNCIVLIKCYNN